VADVALDSGDLHRWVEGGGGCKGHLRRENGLVIHRMVDGRLLRGLLSKNDGRGGVEAPRGDGGVEEGAAVGVAVPIEGGGGIDELAIGAVLLIFLLVSFARVAEL
jgi:hypothetical protein